MFDSPLFWYRLVFIAELFAAEGLFTFKLKKRPYFALRAAAAVVLCYAVTVFFPLFANAFYVSAMFIALFCLTIAGLAFCYREPLLNIIFCAVAAYAVQHIAYELYTFIIVAYGLNLGTFSYVGTGKTEYSIWTFAFYLGSYVVVYGYLYALFGTRINARSDLRIDRVPLLVISGVIVLVAVLLNAVTTYRVDPDTDVVLLCMIHGYNLLCCLLAAFIQFSMLREKTMKSELDTLQRLRKQEQQHYMLFKDNVDYINVKCHDLKHQIRRIAAEGAVNDRVISEIENAVMIYDSEVKTGNDTLDVILTEKRLLCVKNKITFSCIADGKRLDFMSDADICSLFGNALDNAVEAVCGIAEPDKRSIGLTVKSIRDFLSVSVQNSCGHDVVFDGDLPRTTKGDPIYHGYGMKSMKAVTERYGGEMSVVAEDGIFRLNILFPALSG